MTDEQIAMILSICGMIVTILSFQAKGKTGLLIMQTVGTAFYLSSYVFCDGGIAVILNVIYLVRNFLFMYFKNENPKARYVTCVALCVCYAVSYGVYTAVADKSLAVNLWNLLPIVGAFFGTVALVQTNVNRLRMWKYGDSVSWLAFNVRIGLGALGGIIGEILNLISLTVGIIRYKKIYTKNEVQNEKENV